MLETVKNWYEGIKKVPTEASNWGVETIELEKEELDIKLLPENVLERLPEKLSISFYYYSYMFIYEIIYVLPLESENQYILGLLKDDKLKVIKEIEWKAEESES